MGILGYSGWQLLTQLPNLLVLVAGLGLALANRRLPRGPRGLLIGGVAVLLLGAVVNLVWVLAFPRLIEGGWTSAQLNGLSLLVGPVQALLHPAGLALVIAAALAGRRSAGPGAPPPHLSGWPEPAAQPTAVVIPPQPTERP